MSVRKDLDDTRREVTGLVWTRRSRLGKVGVSVLGVVVAYVTFALVAGVLIHSPNDTTTPAIAEPTPAMETTETTIEETTMSSFPSRSERCEEQYRAVDEYDIFAGSRQGYLLALHLLQRKCPDVAKREGLDSEFLPKCGPDLTAENCTAYEGP